MAEQPANRGNGFFWGEGGQGAVGIERRARRCLEGEDLSGKLGKVDPTAGVVSEPGLSLGLGVCGGGEKARGRPVVTAGGQNPEAE